jgi:hypothetical protein
MSFKKYAIKGNNKQRVKNPTPEQLKRRRYDASRTQRNRNYVLAEIKRRGCCEFCGVVLHEKVYQWHHIWDNDPTKRGIADMKGRHTEKDFDIEFKKVVMLCPTCHTIFHMDLCCMLEHKQHHIDGTFYTLGLDDIEEPVKETITKTSTLINFLI